MNSIQLSLNDNFNGDPASIDCLRLIMTGDGACDVILNRKIKEEHSGDVACVYGNLYIIDTVNEIGNTHDDTGEDYCIVIVCDGSENDCTLYSRNDISFNSGSGGGLS